MSVVVVLSVPVSPPRFVVSRTGSPIGVPCRVVWPPVARPRNPVGGRDDRIHSTTLVEPTPLDAFGGAPAEVSATA
jgi:hypothetical protein